MRAYDFSPLFRYSVGFDRMQRLLDSALERSESAPSYPPYNIELVGENAYRITMAVAGHAVAMRSAVTSPSHPGMLISSSTMSGINS